MIKGLVHVCIATRDLAATERFYCAGLGFEKAFDFIRGREVDGSFCKAIVDRSVETDLVIFSGYDECPWHDLCHDEAVKRKDVSLVALRATRQACSFIACPVAARRRPATSDGFRPRRQVLSPHSIQRGSVMPRRI